MLEVTDYNKNDDKLKRFLNSVPILIFGIPL
jgi:hypothetical protein